MINTIIDWLDAQVTWDNLVEIVAIGLVTWFTLAVGVALLVGKSIKYADDEAARCQFCGGPHEGMTTLCSDDLEESSRLG